MINVHGSSVATRHNYLDLDPEVEGHLPHHDETKEAREVNDQAPFAALAFKIATDPFVGKLTFFRVYSGVLNSGSYVYNSTKDKRERVGRLLQMHANKREEIEEVRAGDIAAAIGLKDTRTGDTLCNEDKPIILEAMKFPAPVIDVAIEPKTKADQDKLAIALQKLAEEDPTFRVRSDAETGQTIERTLSSPATQCFPLHVLMFAHAKKYCRSRNPKCRQCNLVTVCPSGKLRLRHRKSKAIDAAPKTKRGPRPIILSRSASGISVTARWRWCRRARSPAGW